MASPNVGKITVGVEFDTKNIEKQLTQDVSKKLLPILERFNTKARASVDNINRINAKPLAEIARMLNMEQTASSLLQRREAAYLRQERAVQLVEDRKARITQDKANATRRLRREQRNAQRERRAVSQQAIDDLDNEREALAAVNVELAEQIELQRLAGLAVTEKQNAENTAFNNSVAAARKQMVAALAANERLRREPYAAIVRSKISKSQFEIKEITKVRNAEIARIKAVAEADEKAAKAARKRRNDLLSLKAVRSTIGQIGRSLGGLSLGLSPAAFTTIVSTLGLVAGGAAAASQALWLMPAAIGAVAGAMVSLKIGMMGFSDTVSALIDGDLDKFDELIQKLSPNAQQAALTLQKVGPAFAGFKNAIQDALFKDTPQMIAAMTTAYAAPLKSFLTGIAGSLNRFMGNAFKQLLTPETSGALNNAMNSILQAFRVLEPAIAPFVATMAKLFEVGAALLPRFAEYLTKVAIQFSNFVQKNADNGNLTRWIEEGVAMIGEFFNLAVSFGKAIYALAPIAEAVLPVIIDLLSIIGDLMAKYPQLAEAAIMGFVAFKVLKKPIMFIIGLFKKGLPAGLSNGLAAMGTLLSRFGTVIMGIMGVAGTKALKAFLVPLKGLTGFFMRVLPVAVAGGLTKMGLLLSQFATVVLGPLGAKVAAAFAPITAVIAAAGAGTWLGTKIYNAISGDDLSVLEAVGKIKAGDINASATQAWEGVPFIGGLAAAEDRERYGNRQPGAVETPTDLLDALGPILGSDGNPVPVEVTELPKPQLPVGAVAPPSGTLGGTPVVPQNALVPAPGSVLPDFASMFPDGTWGTAEILPVPPSPVDERGNKIPEVTESDIRARIDADPRFDPRNFMPDDPYAAINGITNQPGWPGRPELNVNVANMPPGFGAAAYPGAAAMPGFPGAMTPGAGYMGDNALLARIPKGAQFQYGGKDLMAGLADCTSSLEDLVNTIDGLPTAGREFNTENAEEWLTKRGFKPTNAVVPGAFNIAYRTEAEGTAHAQATLPEGTFFNWGFPGAAAAGGRQGPGAADPTLPHKWYRPVGVGPGMPAAPAMPGAPVAPVAPVGSFNALTLANDMGVKPVMENLAAYIQATFPGLKLTSGSQAGGRLPDGGNHDTGNAIDIAIPGDQTNDPKKLALALWAQKHLSPYLTELIYSDPGFSGNIKAGRPVGDGVAAFGADTMAGHVNHVHIAIRDEMMSYVRQLLGAGSGLPATAGLPGAPVTPTAPGLPQIPGMNIPLGVDASGAPRSLRDGLYENLGPLVQDPATGDWGQMRTDNERIAEAAESLESATQDLAQANADAAKEAQALAEGASTQQQVNEKLLDVEEKTKARNERIRELEEAKRGTFEALSSDDPRSTDYKIDFDELPLGDPRKAMAAFIGGLGGGDQTIAAALGLLGQPVGGAIASAGSTALLPLGTPAAPAVDPMQLARERNPAFFAGAAGYEVPDYSREGGGLSAQDLQAQTAPPMLANGAITSNTAASIDRTLTNTEAANQAKLDQVLSVMQQVKTQLTAEVLGPIVEKSIAAGISGISAEALQQLGKAIGEAAGPVVAQAVREVLNETDTQPQGKALGGPITGGTPNRDSVPALLMPGEFVLTTAEVQRMGGFAGVERFRAALARGGVARFATGGPVGVRTGNPNGGQDVSGSVGADFFGVSQIPVLAVAINALVAVLLQVIDVQIIARDSLIEVGKEFKEFRGEFKAFDASGRIRNNNAGLSDRSSSSEQQVANERIRILKLVLQGIINFLIEKIIVPISKALANAIVSAFANGATAALGTFFPGSDILAGILSAALTAAAEVFIQIAADVFTIAAELFFAVGLEAISELLQTIFPQLTTTFFSGAGLEGIVGPISQGLIGLTGILTVAFGNLTGLFAGLLSGITGAGPIIQTLLAGFTPLTAVLSGLVGVLASILQALSILVGGIVNAGSTISASVVGTVTLALNALLGGFIPVVSGLNTSVANLGAVNANIANLLGGFGGLLTGVTGMLSIFKLPTASVNPSSTPAVGPVASTIDNLVSILGNATPGPSTTTTINAPITVVGAAVNTANQIGNRLLSLTR